MAKDAFSGGKELVMKVLSTSVKRRIVKALIWLVVCFRWSRGSQGIQMSGPVIQPDLHCQRDNTTMTFSLIPRCHRIIKLLNDSQ